MALGLERGDTLAYEIEEGRVVLTRVEHPADPFVYPFIAFTEWSSEADSAYDDLDRR